MIRRLITPLAWLLAGVTLSSGTAFAATGGALVLGRSNSASGSTGISSTQGPPLALRGPASVPPLYVGANSMKVAHFNSDLLDGLDASAFQRRVVGGCGAGQALQSVNPSGAVLCVALPRGWVAVVAADGTLDHGSPGVTSGHYLNAPGSFFVQLPESVADCAWTVTTTGRAPTTATVEAMADDPTYVGVTTWKGTAATYTPFHLLVSCP